MKKLVTLLLVLFAFAPLQAKIHFTDLPDTLQVDLDTKYAVHWSVTFTPVVSQGSDDGVIRAYVQCRASNQ